MSDPADLTPACQGADFTKLLAHLGANLQAHAERDYPDNLLRQAVHVARGAHAPGEVCPSEPPREPEHYYLCEYPDDECTCHLYGVHHG